MEANKHFYNMVFTVERELNAKQKDKLIEYLTELMPDEQESNVNSHFIAPCFIEALGFSLSERVSEFKTRYKGNRSVDYALCKNMEDKVFSRDKANPFILMELKGRDIDLSYDTASYKSTVKQIKGYLLDPKCKSAQWGIITNSKHIQLFRKHGKTIFPATACLEINLGNIGQITKDIRQKIEQTDLALTIAVYNNKGGVGKTTTVINLAATLTRYKKKVLVVDFDPNQRDLSDSLNAKVGNYKLGACLKDKADLDNLRQTIYPFATKFKNGSSLSFDVIPVDDDFSAISEEQIRHEISPYTLRKKLAVLKSEYDYILIDAPPNWRFHSVSAINAADVVLIPTRHNNIRSLQNAAVTITEHIPEVQHNRQAKSQGLEWGAIALPIFFNGGKPTHPAKIRARNALVEIINTTKKQSKFDLLPYFFPLYKSGNDDRRVFELPNSAYIANCGFDKIPAVYRYKVAHDYYSLLAKEYFLQ